MMADVRNNWEGRIINGVFPLRRFLGSSNHSSVFLTESPVEDFLNAAIKIVPADAAYSQVQLWQWKTASTFSHPHLMRLLDSGQCELDGQSFLFVVMEYAEESLSQILPYRALGPDEVQELLVPTLDALALLHSENWIQGQLKPSNFLVVNDQLKLAIDTIRPVGVSQMGPRRPSIYDAPESDDGNVAAASDVWALGVTITEALTQYPPTWLGGRSDPPTLPTNLPPTFVDTIQRCLSAKADDRPTVAELQVQTRPGQPLQPAPQRLAAQSAPSQPQRLGAQASQVEPQREAAQEAQSQRQSARGAPPPSQRPTSPPPSVARPENAIPPAPAPPLAIPEPEPPMRADPIRPEARAFPELEEESKRGVLIPALIALVVVGAAVWGGTKLLGGRSAPSAASSEASTVSEQAAGQDQHAGGDSSAGPSSAGAPAAANTLPPGTSPPQRAPRASGPSPADGTTPSATARASTPPGTARASTTAAASRGPVGSKDSSTAAVHEEIPTISASSRNTIHGHVRVAVRVTVDGSGRVIRDALDNPSPSRYFNRVASEAARKWRFAAADQSSREWLLRFEFGRDGASVHAVGPRS